MIESKDNIIIVDPNVLFNNGRNFFYGFRRAEPKSVDLKSRILDKHDLVSYKRASDYPGFKRLVVCSFIINPDKYLISAYRMNPLSKEHKDLGILKDDISHGYWLCGYKNYLRSIDITLNEPIAASTVKDLKKEVEMDGDILSAKLLGYIYDNNPLRLENFVMVYALRTNAEKVVKKDACSSTMINIRDLRRIVFPHGKLNPCSGFDLWTRQAIHSLDSYIQQFHSKDSFEW